MHDLKQACGFGGDVPVDEAGCKLESIRKTLDAAKGERCFSGVRRVVVSALDNL
ncbi:hypothetical protein [Nitrosomonas oligotropha]|uniref:hypothetical protein n=1 Tax=Nitrosomonas oligotropha TaxID=42354 RepID=UPI001367FFC0|nr:hypothetical protein [Nitrosomonas oligotropha]